MSTHDSDERLESAPFLQSVLEAVPAFVLLLDDDDRILYINRVQPGLVRSEVIGRSTYDFIAPDYHAEHRRILTAAREQGGQHSYLIKGAGADGGIAYYESRSIGVDGPDGRRRVYQVAMDVTEHIMRAEALRESEEKLRLAVEATGIGLWSWDLPENRVGWSPRMHEITGCPLALDGQSYVEVCVHPDDQALMGEQVTTARHGVASYPVHRIVRPDGETRWVAPFGSFAFDQAGNPTRMLGGLVDVTEQRNAEEHLRQSQKLDALGTLSAGIAHNFNNVLAVIVPSIELALKDPAIVQGGNTHEMLAEAANAARRAAKLVAQLMTSAGQHAVARQRLDLAKLLKSVSSMCRQILDSQCELALSIAADPLWVLGDSAALEQVFLNLVLNARDALGTSAQPAPRISVELEAISAAKQARVIVSDNGPGLSDAAQSRLFEPFFTTKPQGQGTGLGLWASRATVHDHGGSLTIVSAPGRGTRCEVLLPCVADAALEPVRPATQKSRVSGRILLVDDEAPLRAVLRKTLESSGHTVFEADRAETGVALLDQGTQVDVVLLDRSMPGWPAQRTIAELRARTKAAILFFTGQHIPPAEAALVEEVLQKPLAMQELEAAIGKWLQQRQ